jgi:thiol-disulfide isomerase/thioredoxin
VRNLTLAALAVAVVAAGPGSSFPSGLAHLSGTQTTLALVTLLAILLALATGQLWGEGRRLRRELEAAQAAARQPGLPRGSQAPEFTLVPVRGEAASLADLLQSGRPAVLVFVSIGCGPCLQMLPDLARWQGTLDESLTLAAIFSGDRSEVERVADEHGLRIVLAEEANEIFELYALRATPSGLEITGEGKIASAPAEGSPAIEALVRAVLSRTQPQQLLVHHG